MNTVEFRKETDNPEFKILYRREKYKKGTHRRDRLVSILTAGLGGCEAQS